MAGNEPGGNVIIEGFVSGPRPDANGQSGNAARANGVSQGGDNRAGIGSGTGEIVIDPAEIGSGGTSGPGEPERKRRGRKPGSTNAQKAEKSANLKQAIASGIFLFHGFLYTTFKAPELQLSEAEAERLGAAFDNLMSCYDVGVSKKTAAWIEVSSAMAGVYGGRILHYSMRTARVAGPRA